MIIVAQTKGTGLTNLAVNESTFTSRTGLPFEFFEYDGANWKRTTQTPSTTANLANYGITFTGTPVSGDAISVAHQDSQLWTFYAGNGVNCEKLNENFMELQNITNSNESAINTISNTALLKDGSNITQSLVNIFQQEVPNILSTSGTIALADNSSNFLTLTGNGTISLPTIASDQYSHTIILVVAGGTRSLNLGTTKSLGNAFSVDTTKAYQVIYIYNKLDNNWYYCLGQ